MAFLDHPQFWENHYSVVFPPPGVSREPAPGRRLPIEVKLQTEADLRRIIPEFAGSSKTVHISIAGMAPANFTLHSFGRTAMVAKWYRLTEKGLDPEAVTLCLGGVDARDDETAIGYVFDNMLRAYLSHADAAGYANNVRSQPRPAGVRVHFDATSYDNQALRVCSTCLAVAFFRLTVAASCLHG